MKWYFLIHLFLINFFPILLVFENFILIQKFIFQPLNLKEETRKSQKNKRKEKKKLDGHIST